MNLFLISVCGAVGALCRYGIEEFVELRRYAWRPYATMFVNALGCFFAVLVVRLVSVSDFSNYENWHWFFITGFCGGFTTFSSALALPLFEWRRGERTRSLIILVGTPLLCILATALAVAVS